MGECSFWYRPTRVVPDQRPLNGRCCCCCKHQCNFSDGEVEVLTPGVVELQAKVLFVLLGEANAVAMLTRGWEV